MLSLKYRVLNERQKEKEILKLEGGKKKEEKQIKLGLPKGEIDRDLTDDGDKEEIK